MSIDNDKTHSLPAFIADCHLGKLAKYLRLVGYDTLYFSKMDDNDLIALAIESGRIILTRDKALAKRQNAPVILLEPKETRAQLKTVLNRFDLAEHPVAFSRCIVCNTPLEVVDKADVMDRLPEKVKRCFSHFEQCRVCDRIYWHGDHYRHMQRFLESVYPTAS